MSGLPAHGMETLHQVHKVLCQLFNLFLAPPLNHSGSAPQNKRLARFQHPPPNPPATAAVFPRLCPVRSSGRWLTILTNFNIRPLVGFVFVDGDCRRFRIQWVQFAASELQGSLIYEVISLHHSTAACLKSLKFYRLSLQSARE